MIGPAGGVYGRAVSRFRWLLGVIVLVLGAACAPAYGATDGRVEAFRQALDAAGFQVRAGQSGFADPPYFVDAHLFNSAMGNNAGQPYKRIDVPPFRQDALREQGSFIRLAPYEAIVYLGPTPPPVDYFSFTPYLWVRRYQTPPLREWLTAAVGDPLNNALIKTEGPGDPFQKNTMIIFTADEGIYERVAAAAQSAGYPASMLNLYTMPSSVLRMGTSLSSDMFVFVIRTANFKDAAVRRRYLLDKHWANVFRITPRSVPALRPLAQPPWRARDWRRESALVPGVDRALERLRRAILRRTPHSTARQFGSVRWFYDSKDVLLDDPSSPAYRQFVAAEGSDTPYRRTARNGRATNFKLGLRDRAVVYGVNHAATGLATYSTFAVYGDFKLNNCITQRPRFLFGCGERIWNGVVSMNSHDYTGSARRYLPNDRLARYLYAVTVVRTKSRCPGGRQDPYCLVVPRKKRRHRPPSAHVIGLNYPLMIGYRAYLNPRTGAGPSYRDTIPDRVTLFPATR
jgi:hypothetical protein